ncbi:MAG TPA: helix-turn-helix domain-containing protein [Actinomycetes bacterium]|nr:helix-turn-helix domain-containing protein [Actinomycetes bacterium]
MSLGALRAVEDGEPPQVSTLRVLAHPVRLRILSTLTGRALSAAEIAREIGISQVRTSYHVRQLASAGLVRLVEDRGTRTRGERRYTCASERFDQISDDPEARPLLYRALADELLRRSSADGGSGSRTLADAELWVCPHLWTDVVARVKDALDDLHRGARPPESPGAVPVSVTVAMFRQEHEET